MEECVHDFKYIGGLDFGVYGKIEMYECTKCKEQYGKEVPSTGMNDRFTFVGEGKGLHNTGWVLTSSL